MSAPDIFANMSRGWNRNPSGVAQGTGHTGVSAALWRHDGTGILEIAPLVPELHTLSIQFGPSSRIELRNEDAAPFSGTVGTGVCNLTKVGQTTSAAIRGRLSVLQLYLPDALIRAAAQACDADTAQAIELVDPRFTHDPQIERLGREILAEMREGQPLSRLRIDALGQDFAIQLLRRWSNLAGQTALTRSSGGLAPWQVKRATEFLMAHLDADVSLAELADVARLSTFHFARAFKRSTGLPPQRFLMERRVERARELLAGTDLGLAEIALSCGFAGQSHFTTAFKRHTGVTPGAWRAAVRN